MGDPLSIASSVAGLLSLGIQLSESLLKYYQAIRDRRKDVGRAIMKLKTLVDTLRAIDNEVQDRNNGPGEADILQTIYTAVQSCEEIILELRSEWEKFDISRPDTRVLDSVRATGHRAIYPLRQSTLQKLDEDITDMIQHLSLALDVLHLKDDSAIQTDVNQVKTVLHDTRKDQVLAIIREWLKAPDVVNNHNATSAKRHCGTGLWFIKGNTFQTWLRDPNSFLWLNGFAGCGKSVLCSTAIQHTVSRGWDNPADVGTAFFFFTFDDESKQDGSAMLRALLLQLSEQHPECHANLVRLHRTYRPWVPATEVLLEHLRLMAQRFGQVYIFLDALDESPRDKHRESVLNAVETMRGWGIPGLHFLVTSRDEADIRRALRPAPSSDVSLKNDAVKSDIRNYICDILKTNPELQRWERYHDQIQTALLEHAQGVFRYVECQFNCLKRCPRTKAHLLACLRSLPHGLDETYERMLCSIDRSLIEDARRILTLLCYSSRPLSVGELIDAHASDIDGLSQFTLEDRRLDVESLIEICSGLLEIPSGHITASDSQASQTVRIAHYSVQEYLQSERIKEQKAAVFALESQASHAAVANICLAYLLETQLSEKPLDEASAHEFPFASYAAEFWHHHYKNAGNMALECEAQISKLFKDSPAAFKTWVRIFAVDKPFRGHKFDLSSNKIASPLYYASFLGLDFALNSLSSIHRPGSTSQAHVATDINKRGGYYGYPLQAASSNNHFTTVQWLLDWNADFNAQGGKYGNALQAASSRGHTAVVELLLDHGADINAKCGFFGTALHAAAHNGHIEVLHILLHHGADLNAVYGRFSTALQAACAGGHESIANILLAKGADVRTQGGDLGSPLQAAALRGQEGIVHALLAHGSDPNIEGGQYGWSLQAAALAGNESVVRILLDRGAEVNAQGGQYGNALQAALSFGHQETARVLLQRGADIYRQGGRYGNALQAACLGGLADMVEMLLDKGLDANIQGGKYGTALQGAAARGHEAVTKLLLSRNANVKAQALEAARYANHCEIARILHAAGGVSAAKI